MGFQSDSIDSKYKKHICSLRNPTTRAKSVLKDTIQKSRERFLEQADKLETGEKKNRLLKKLDKVTQDLKILENLSEDDIIEFALTTTRKVMAVASNPRVPREMRMKARVACHKPLSSHLARVKSLVEAGPDQSESDEETDTADNTKGNLDRITVYNQIVKMRNDVKRAKVHLIHKFTRIVKLLRNSKGNEEKKTKCQRKAERFVKKIKHIKEVNVDDVSKFALSTKTEDVHKLIADVKIPMMSQAMAIITLQKFVAVAVEDFRNKYPDWSKTVPSLLKKKKKKRKLDKEVVSGAKNKLNKDLRIMTNNDGEDSNDDSEKSEFEKDGRSDISNSDSEEESLKSSSENGSDEDREEEDRSDRVEEIENNLESEGEKDESLSSNDEFQNNSESDIKKSTTKVTTVKSLKRHLEVPKPQQLSTKLAKTTVVSQKKSNVADKEINNKGEESDKCSPLKKSLKPRPVKEKPKVVDPFFMTTTNEEYLTSQVPTISEDDSNKQSKSDDFNQTRFDKFSKFNSRNKWGSREDDWKRKRFSNQESQHNQKPFAQRSEKVFNNGPEPFNIFTNRKERRKALQQPPQMEKVEKLHPSWEAKKKQTSIASFQGKKITFD